MDKKQNKKWWFLIGGIIIIFILISALGGAGEKNTNQNPLPQEESNENEQAMDRCLDVSKDTVLWIESGLTNDNITFQNTQAVQSNDFEKVYFVSTSLQELGPEESQNIATFATNNIEGTGLVLSVNTAAKEFTDWFHSDKEGAQYHNTMENDGARESQICITR